MGLELPDHLPTEVREPSVVVQELCPLLPAAVEVQVLVRVRARARARVMVRARVPVTVTVTVTARVI